MEQSFNTLINLEKEIYKCKFIADMRAHEKVCEDTEEISNIV